jgi:hypothetical protein
LKPTKHKAFLPPQTLLGDQFPLLDHTNVTSLSLPSIIDRPNLYAFILP